MIELISKETLERLLALSKKKKVAFLLLLYDRMIAELRSFCVDEGVHASVFETARDESWRWLVDQNSPNSWPQRREAVLNSAPDSEQFGTSAALFALNAALVLAEIIGFIEDGGHQHIADAIGYARDSLDAKASNEMEVSVYDQNVELYVAKHPLVLSERMRQQEDVALLNALEDEPWSGDMLGMLQERAAGQKRLLEN